jgi:hypothetical protein
VRRARTVAFIMVTALVALAAPQAPTMPALASPRTQVVTGPAGGEARTLSFVPEADTYVDETQPATSFGASPTLWVDGNTVKQTFLRFRLSGLAGVTVTALRLRMYQSDASPAGGRVWTMSNTTWDEATTTWATRPAIDGSMVGDFGPVVAAQWYETPLAIGSPADGPLSLALDSPDPDAAKWRSREHANVPQLLIDVELPPTDGFEFVPAADTYVDASQPAVSFGGDTGMWADASPVRQSLVRFDLSGLAGRTILGVRLRAYVTDPSPSGGRIFGVPDTTWDESTTWDTRPSLGPQLGSFGSVSGSTWYEADLGSAAVAGDGAVAFAIDSTNADGVKWATREHARLPRLIVDVARVPGLVLDGLSTVAPDYVGSSDPTFFANNRHLAVTAGGRQLAVYGRHATGLQLAWRDPGGGWMTSTRGYVPDGLLLAGSGTGDWPASIVVGTDSMGAEHAWVVYGGWISTSTAPVRMRRLSDLDNPAGPSVGPTVAIPTVGLGNSKVDLAFETAPGGQLRGAVSWLQHTSTSVWDQMVAWFTDLDTDTPPIVSATSLASASGGGRAATLISTPAGMRLVVRNAPGALQLFAHDATAPLSSWAPRIAGMGVPATAYPGGVALGSGEILAAAETNATSHTVKVQRFSASGGTATIDLQLAGYEQPSLATDGTQAWLVMVRAADGVVVSRQLTGAGWSGSDRVEIGTPCAGACGWPNLVRATDGRLRLVVGGPALNADQASVLAFQRGL